MDYIQILKVINQAGFKEETVEIYYPKTDNSSAGWREIEPYSLSTDIGGQGEHLIYGQDRLSPGHILNAYTIGNRGDHPNSFIIGKIKKARLTKRKFKPKWKVEFTLTN